MNPLCTVLFSNVDPGVYSAAFIGIFLSPNPTIGENFINRNPSFH